MLVNVKWPETETFAEGRNGLLKCFGVELLQSYDNRILITPINSKGNVSRCTIQIPESAIPEICNALNLLAEKSKEVL